MLEKKDPWNSQTEAVSDKPAESKWVIDIKNKLELARADAKAGPGAWKMLSIYRIPKRLRNKDEKAYTPQMVSLGPYHHGDKRLSGMERHKWRALHQVLERMPGHRIEDYLEAVKKIEEDARACYEGPLEMSSDKFVEMLLLDSTFVLEIFRGADQGFESLGYSPGDPIFTLCAGSISIMRDMIMLENQIPLFVLDQIHNIQCPKGPPMSVASLALRFFEPLAPTYEAPIDKELAVLADQSGLHCLEVFRRSLLAVREEPEPTPSPGCIKKWCIKKWFHPRGENGPRTRRVVDKDRPPMIYNVTKLKEAGAIFLVRDTHRICDIDFYRGILEIPRLLVQDSTKSLFQNLIAFEQCHQDCTDDITLYAIFMDKLIDSPADVAYLHHCRAVENYLGSNAEVSDLFNCLCREVVVDTDDTVLTKKIDRYYYHMWYEWNSMWYKWRAILINNYFNSPWSIISFIAATVLVLLTAAQTFFAVYAYYVSPS